MIGLAIDDGIRAGNAGVLTVAALVFLGVTLGQAGGTAVQLVVNADLGQRMLQAMRMEMFRKYQALPLGFYDRQITGRLIGRMASDVEQVGEAVTEGAIGLVADMAILIGILVAMALLSWELTLIAVAVAPFMLLSGIVFARVAQAAYRVMRTRTSTLNGVLAESILGMRVIQAFTREEVNARRFDEVNHAQAQSQMRAMTVTVVGRAGGGGIHGDLDRAGVVAGRVVCAGRVGHGDTGRGDGLCAVHRAVLRSGAGVARRRWGAIQAAMTSAERVFEILDTDETMHDQPHARELPPVRGEVRFERVSFAYEAGRPVLHEAEIVAKPGDRIALVGATGAGKTTIINLLLRFYDATNGSVRIDGHDVRRVSQASLRRQIGLVLQEPFLFSGSIHDNIAYGRAEATREEVIEVAKAVRLHEFVESLPFGYDTPIEERGGGLSTGQRQLVSFARALLTDPRVAGAGRGDEFGGHADRRSNPGRDGDDDAGPHEFRDRAPALDGAERDRGAGDGPGPHRGTRHARGTAGEGRALLQPVHPGAVDGRRGHRRRGVADGGLKGEHSLASAPPLGVRWRESAFGGFSGGIGASLGTGRPRHSPRLAQRLGAGGR